MATNLEKHAEVIHARMSGGHECFGWYLGFKPTGDECKSSDCPLKNRSCWDAKNCIEWLQEEADD